MIGTREQFEPAEISNVWRPKSERKKEKRRKKLMSRLTE